MNVWHFGHLLVLLYSQTSETTRRFRTHSLILGLVQDKGDIKWLFQGSLKTCNITILEVVIFLRMLSHMYCTIHTVATTSLNCKPFKSPSCSPGSISHVTFCNSSFNPKQSGSFYIIRPIIIKMLHTCCCVHMCTVCYR